MFVSDLRHFLDLPDDAPAPAWRMAEHLGGGVRAATARDAGVSWGSALTCIRRPARRPCPGYLGVVRVDVPSSIEWRCTSCGDDGVIGGWERSRFDLRPVDADQGRSDVRRVVISSEVAAMLRSVTLTGIESERFVFRAYVAHEGVVVEGADDDFDELIGCVAAEANHEPELRRQRRLAAALALLARAERS